MANGPTDTANLKCIDQIVKSNRDKNLIDWLVYFAQGHANPMADSPNVKKAFQQTGWLEQNMFFSSKLLQGNAVYISKLLLQR